MIFEQTIQNIRRVRQITGVLVKYGFEEVVTNTSLQKLVPDSSKTSWVRADKSVFELSTWERIRMAVEELGPTFIKGAQVLSNRPDLLPDDLIEEFGKLQSDVPPFEVSKAKEIIESETGKPFSALFEWFGEEPLGSASIGQVHLAKLKGGKEVVVKVRRPGVAKMVATDLAILGEVARRGRGFFEQQGVLNPGEIVEAFEKSMQKELDYTNEARNIGQFRSFYSNHRRFYVPEAYKELSTKRVLFLEYVKGCKITDVAQLRKWGLDERRIAETGLDIYLGQIFQYGYFHADPHPGNILVREDGTICLIDFGMVGKLSKRDKFAFAGFFIGMSQQDPHGMATSLRKLALSDNVKDMRLLEHDLNELLEDFGHMELQETSMAELSSRLQRVIYDYKLRVPGGVFILLRALAILEGIGKTVHPEMNPLEFVKPYGGKLIREQFSARNIGFELYSGGNDLMSFLQMLPLELKDLLVQMRKGTFTGRLVLDEDEELRQTANKIANRLILALLSVGLYITAAMVLGSSGSYGWTTKGGVPYFGLIAVCAAVFFTALVLNMIWRNR